MLTTQPDVTIGFRNHPVSFRRPLATNGNRMICKYPFQMNPALIARCMANAVAMLILAFSQHCDVSPASENLLTLASGLLHGMLEKALHGKRPTFLSTKHKRRSKHGSSRFAIPLRNNNLTGFAALRSHASAPKMAGTYTYIHVP